MFEKFTESKPIELKETAVKRLARKMLERFLARIKKAKEVECIKVEIATEEEKPAIIVPKFDEPKAIIESPEPKAIEYSEVKPAANAKEEREKKTDKGVYESVVTNNYFESWDQLELEGNPEIKEKIKENIIRAEKNNQYLYERAADDLGISIEELKELLQTKIESIVGQSEFFRATDIGVLEKIMNADGRWKSQFETNTSGGSLNPAFRAQAENKMFGFSTDLENNKEKRPIYGYFSDEEHGAINYEGKIPPINNVSGYGAINIKLKKENVLKKATLTFQDSLDINVSWPPTPATKPHFTSFSWYGGGKMLNEFTRSSMTNWGAHYDEVQYHNQLTMADVEAVYVSVNNGLSPEQIKEVRQIFNKYKEQHPESTIELIEF